MGVKEMGKKKGNPVLFYKQQGKMLILNFSDIFCIKKGGLLLSLLQAGHI